MKQKIIKLIDLKSIITILLSITLIWGFIVGKISPDVFIPFVSMTFTFFFTKKDKKESE